MREAGAGRGNGTGPRRRSFVAWTIAVASIALIGSSFAIKLAYGTVFGAEDTALIVPGLLGGIAFAVVGALIAARTGNAVGWVFLGIAASFAVSAPAQNWVDAAIELGRPLAFVGLANWLSQWPFFLGLGLFPAVFFLYPTGSLPSRRWRLPWRLYVGSLVVTVAGFALLPYRWDGIPGEIVTNPVGVEPLEPVLGVLLAVAGVTLVLSAFVALASLIVRARGSGPDERQQIRWLGMVGRVGGVLFLLLLVAGFSSGDRNTGFAASATNLLMVLLVITIVVGIPTATAIAIFRFRLYDLDLVIRKTVIFALLVAMLLAIGGIAAVGVVFPLVPSLYDTPPLMLLLGLTYGLLAIPLYRLAKRIADRVVFGGRASPYEVLTEFSERVGETYASDDVLPRMAAVLGEGTGADTATVWLLRRRPDASSGDLAPRRGPAGLGPAGCRGGPPSRRRARCALGLAARERPDEPVEVPPARGPRVAGGARAAERAAHRGAAGISTATRRGAGRGAAPTRAEHPRRGAAAARRAAGPAEARPFDGGSRPGEGGRADRHARRPLLRSARRPP